MFSKVITERMAQVNRDASNQAVTRLYTLCSEISAGEHGEITLTVKVKDGRIIGLDESKKIQRLFQKPDHVRRAA